MPRMILAPALTSATAPPVPRRKFLGGFLAALAGGSLLGRARDAFGAPASALSADPFIGEIAIVPYNFAPSGWALCNGQLLSIAQNTALFSLLGTNYGGNGTSTFGLPDLRGRFPLHANDSTYVIGQVGGESSHVLLTTELPSHAHALQCDSANGTSDSPAGGVPARNPAGIPAWGATAATAMGASAIGAAGGSQPHNNMPPYLSLYFIISLFGIFPSRP